MVKPGSKQISVRFYWVHDFDLVGLTACKDFSLSDSAKKALVAYANRDNVYRIHVPDEAVSAVTSKDYLYRPCKDRRASKRLVADKHMKKIKNFNMHFWLNPEKDDERAAIEFLHTLSAGTRCSAIKQILRSYLDKPNLYPYLTDASYFFVPGTPVSDGDVKDTDAISQEEASSSDDGSDVCGRNDEVHTPDISAEASQIDDSEVFGPGVANSSSNDDSSVYEAVLGANGDYEPEDVFDILDKAGY